MAVGRGGGVATSPSGQGPARARHGTRTAWHAHGMARAPRLAALACGGNEFSLHAFSLPDGKYSALGGLAWDLPPTCSLTHHCSAIPKERDSTMQRSRTLMYTTCVKTNKNETNY